MHPSGRVTRRTLGEPTGLTAVRSLRQTERTGGTTTNGGLHDTLDDGVRAVDGDRPSFGGVERVGE